MLGLFSTKTTSPSHMFETLSRLQTKREGLAQELAKTDTEIQALKDSLNQLLGNTPTPTPAQHNQPLGTTQVTPAQHNVEHNRTTMAQATTAPNTIPTLGGSPRGPKPHNAKVSAGNNVIQSRLATSNIQARETNAPPATAHISKPATNSGIPNMAAIVNDRAPYHTEELQITGVQPQGQIVMYKHYLSGDGISSGIPALEGCNVTIKQSASGNIYRQMETPALKITCTLAQPLPTGFVEQKRAIREWLAANEYLTSSDSSKTPFECEYDAYGNMYTPYVSVDTKGLKLYIYIGCASLTSARPCPTLIA